MLELQTFGFQWWFRSKTCLKNDTAKNQKSRIPSKTDDNRDLLANFDPILRVIFTCEHYFGRQLDDFVNYE